MWKPKKKSLKTGNIFDKQVNEYIKSSSIYPSKKIFPTGTVTEITVSGFVFMKVIRSFWSKDDG